MILTYESIREIKQKEKNSELQKLPENFFSDALEYLKVKTGSSEEASARRLIISIFDLRIKKIMNLAMMYYTLSRTPENLEPFEKDIYISFVKTLKEGYGKFKDFGFIDAVNDDPKEKTSIENKKEKPTQTETDRKKVVFSVALPEILLPNGESHSFSEGDEIELDKTFASLLAQKGFCKFV